MEPEKPNLGVEQQIPEIPLKTKEKRIFVYTVRDWKEYLGESLLIIFSVLLVVTLTEYFNHLNEKEKTKIILENIVAELNHNRTSIQEMQQYNLQILKTLDSALVNTNLQNEIVSNDEFHLKILAPQGLLYRYLNDEAWEIAKTNSITSKIHYKTAALLFKVYEDQHKMMRVEDEVARVIFDRNSRDTKQLHTTLIIIKDLYHGWAVDRADGLIQQIDQVIKNIEEK